MQSINEYCETLINAKRYEIISEKSDNNIINTSCQYINTLLFDNNISISVKKEATKTLGIKANEIIDNSDFIKGKSKSFELTIDENRKVSSQIEEAKKAAYFIKNNNDKIKKELSKELGVEIDSVSIILKNVNFKWMGMKDSFQIKNIKITLK